jgi:basic amino acid/polyamine antiporter, APA family
MSENHYRKNFGAWTATSIVIGSVIGSGIFVRPAMMASQLGSPEMILIVWIVAGVISMFGAMISAEMGAMLPHTGGQYVFLKHSYGDFVSFLYGWAGFAVINTAGTACIAFVFSQYMEYFFQLPGFSADIEQAVVLHLPFIGNIFPLQNFGIKALTILVIVLLTAINYRSAKAGGKLQLFFTILKIGVILFIVFGTFILGKGSTENLVRNSDIINPSGLLMIAAFAAATTGAFQSYDGWNNITMVAGEVENPKRNIPLSLLTGLGACMLCYLLINLAFIYMLPVDEIAKSSFVATDAMQKVLGYAGGAVTTVAVLFFTFDCTNANLLSTARISYAMAKEKRFFTAIGTEHKKFRTPGNALLLHMTWMCILVLSGSFEILADMFVFVTWLFYGLNAAGIFILRKKMKDSERPYKVWGYPVIPLIFIGFASYYLLTTLFNDINDFQSGKIQIIKSVFGLALTATGIPFYFFFRKRFKT